MLRRRRRRIREGEGGPLYIVGGGREKFKFVEKDLGSCVNGECVDTTSFECEVR